MRASARGNSLAEAGSAGGAPDEKNTTFRYRFGEFLIEHLFDCLQVFGDLEEMLVMEVVMLQFPPGSSETAVKHDQHVAPLTASRIAKKTGIPRQTVRRKLLLLERRGWVTQTDDAAWRPVMRQNRPAFNADLAQFEKRGFDRVRKLMSLTLV
jgi:hypothetical protein